LPLVADREGIATLQLPRGRYTVQAFTEDGGRCSIDVAVENGGPITLELQVEGGGR
jgi:hypothetical protein